MPFTRTALDEIELILEGALDYGGAEHARKVRARFQRLFDMLDRGVGLGQNSVWGTRSASSRRRPIHL